MPVSRGHGCWGTEGLVYNHSSSITGPALPQAVLAHARGTAAGGCQCGGLSAPFTRAQLRSGWLGVPTKNDFVS